MKYAKWKVYFETPESEGFTPDIVLRDKGFIANGLFYYDNFIIGEISDNADLSNLEKYEIEILSNEDILNIAQSINPNVKLNDINELVWPKYDFENNKFFD